ncbi:MAG: TolC family protein [Myxococcota bacterium]
MIPLLGLALVAAAQEPVPERAVTYAEALRLSIVNNLSVTQARTSRDRAEGTLVGSQGQFDPFYSLDVNRGRSRTQGFAQGIGVPFTTENNTWQVSNSLNTTLPTGTDVSVSTSTDNNQTTFLALGGNDDLEEDTPGFNAFTTRANVSFTQQLLRGVWFRFNVQNVTLARNSLDIAELELERQRQDALYQAAEAYWNWSFQYELWQIALESVRVAEEGLRVGQLQVESGQLAKVEATRLEAALVQAQQTAIDAENTAERAANAVLMVMGQSPDEPVIPATEPGEVPDLVDLDVEQAIEVAMQQNLDLRLAAMNLDQAELSLSFAKHGRLPTLTATATTGVASQRCPAGSGNNDCAEGNAASTFGGLFDDDRQPFWNVSGNFSVPLGNRAARGQQFEAEAQRTQREQELFAQERQVAAMVEEQVLTLRSARVQTELADANLRLAVEKLAAEEALDAAGRNLRRDVLEARTELDRAKANAAKARTDYRLAQAKLLQLQGQLDQAAS